MPAPPYDSTARVRFEEKDQNYTRDCIARKEEPYMSRREIEQEDEEEKNRDWDCGRLRKES